MRRLLASLALASAALPALATSTEEVTVKCPVCVNAFKAENCRSTNSVGGQDRDFCKHAAGGQVFIICCWTCPRCFYTGFPDSFDAGKAPKDLLGPLLEEKGIPDGFREWIKDEIARAKAG